MLMQVDQNWQNKIQLSLDSSDVDVTLNVDDNNKKNKNYHIDRRMYLNLFKSIQSAAGLKVWTMLPMAATHCANYYPIIYIYYCT